MQKHYLHKLFEPSSIAVIGASTRPHSVGMKVFNNLLNGNYRGKIYPVHPEHTQIQGQKVYTSVDQIKQEIDLAVITTPANTVPHIMAQCGEQGLKAAVIISAGFSETGREGKVLEQSILDLAERYHINIIGPNCLGIMRPHLGLNATFDHSPVLPGQIALVSQSGAICAAILDWAAGKEIGFSTMVSLGNAAGLDFGEILDFLTHDPKTSSILLYIEGIHHAKRFMRGLQAAASKKPVIVIKSGRHGQGMRAAHSHTGVLVGDDDVFDAALKQAGALRVLTIDELFSAAKILSSHDEVKGNRLVIISNGGGAGVMAADWAAQLNIALPPLSEKTQAALNEVLPSQWSHQNPIDIIGDATPDRYHAALQICAQDDNIDGLLAILVPVAMANPLKVAEQVIADTKTYNKPLLACWMGERQVKSSWALFAKNNIPCFNTPEKAIEAFSYLTKYQSNQKILSQTMASIPLPARSKIKKAGRIIESALATKQKILTTIQSKSILKLFDIPISEPVAVHSVNQAISVATSLGFPVVMKINSPDITHKKEVGGVLLSIQDEKSVRHAYEQIIHHAKKYRPTATILGVTVERMYEQANTREVMIGVMRDKIFGPVITFGAGGTLVEIIHDRAIALPPLNQYLAKDLIVRTRIAKLLSKYHDMPPADLEILVNILLRVSAMVCELPYIQEMDINPLLVNDKEATAVDARIVIEEISPHFTAYDHLAIHPSSH